MGKEISRRKFFELVFPSVGAVVGVGAAERLGILKTLELLLSPAPESVGEPKSEAPPQVEEVQIQEVIPQPETSLESKTGIRLLERLGLRGKIIYIVYGRPTKHGEPTWGSLGGSRTAEQSWQLFQARKERISQEIGKGREDFTLNVLNPVYRSRNGVIKDIYIQKALELAPENFGLVALSFNSFDDARMTIERLAGLFPKELLASLAVSLDIEHFSPNGQVEAQRINEFTSWFAQKHHQWAGESGIPGLVLIYAFCSQGKGRGRILNMGSLNQYYLDQKTLVATIFDGFGTKEGKLRGMAYLVESLPNTVTFPALVGMMEFGTRWGDKYDKSSIKDIFETLKGTPVFFFASQ